GRHHRDGPTRRRPRPGRAARTRRGGRRVAVRGSAGQRRLRADGARMTAPGVIRILLADDQALVRGALAALLDLEPDLEIVAEVGRGDEVVEAARTHLADVALLDV